MRTSESVVEITKALLAVHEEVGSIGTDADNPFFKSRYATLQAVVRHCQPILHAHGIVALQMPDADEQGVPMLTTRLLHTSGEWIEASAPLQSAKADPQAQGSAVTYARRYDLASAAGLTIDDDDDGEKAMDRPKTRAKPAPEPVRKAGTPEAAHKRMMALFNAKGFEDRGVRLAYACAVIGRDIESSSEMTASERSAVISALESED